MDGGKVWEKTISKIYTFRKCLLGEKVGKNRVTREGSGRLIQIRFERGNCILLLLPKESWNIVREPDTA